MPTPKNGTVTTDVAKAVTEFKAGKVEFKNDKYGILHLVIGTKEFTIEQLLENFEVTYDVIEKAKPSKAKGVYFKSVVLTTTMGPGIKVETQKLKWRES